MYDKYSNSLLIACKGSPDIEKDKLYKGYKAIYKFDLGKMKLDNKPEFLVSLNKPDSYMDFNLSTGSSVNDKIAGLSEYEIGFQPSGLAIHPDNNEIYLIASVGKILIILNREGKVLEWRGLDPAIFDQPEGICFSPSGDLFISNEGKDGKAYILKFNIHK
jgi:DNA-binding beta-propeller fold protein YncE